MSLANGNKLKLTQSTADQPDVSAAINAWFSQISFTRMQKQNVNNFTKEIPISIKTMGVIQPLSAQQIAIKPEGQRTWKWMMIHCLPDCVLKIDDVVQIECDNYRVMGIYDYRRNGYVRYDCGQDYQNSPGGL